MLILVRVENRQGVAVGDCDNTTTYFLSECGRSEAHRRDDDRDKAIQHRNRAHDYESHCAIGIHSGFDMRRALERQSRCERDITPHATFNGAGNRKPCGFSRARIEHWSDAEIE